VTDAEKREKVIFALRYCRENMCGPECPYYYDDINESPADCILERVTGDVLALLKEQEPRVMTLEEVIHSKDWVWYQWKNTHYGWAIAVNCDGKWIEWEDSTTDQLCKYGEKWRCWTSRPTPEQMRDTKWEETDNG
jgi:hypothetical protein